MNIKQIITVGVAGMAMGAMALDNVEVTDVKARQRYPWNGKVDIDFTLDSKATEPYQMQVEVYDNVGKTNLPVKSVCTEGVSVEANPCMVRTDTRRIVWDAAKDLPNGFKCTNVLVTCRDARLIPVDKLYCVIDLTDGSNEYLSGVPAGGWTDEHKTTKMVFRRIEAGSFMMGSPADEVNHQSNETQHKVTLTKPFYISIFEMTEAQYASINGSVSHVTKPVLLEYHVIRGREGSQKCPTEFTWPTSKKIDANSVAGKLRTLTGISTIDMPTEAKWEYAAKGMTVSALNNGFGSTDINLSTAGRYEGNSGDGKGDASSQDVTVVGCYEPNAWGLYDMLGNAREWCVDAWSDDLGVNAAVDPEGNTEQSREVVKVSSAYNRTVKGGGYYDEKYYDSYHAEQWSEARIKTSAILVACRCAWRGKGYSYYQSEIYGPPYQSCYYTREGFRPVFDAD